MISFVISSALHFYKKKKIADDLCYLTSIIKLYTIMNKMQAVESFIFKSLLLVK